MNGFTIKNFQDTASFELEVIQRGDVDDIDALVRTKYDFQGRTINSTHRWSFGLGEVSWFMDKIISTHENLKGCSRFTSFDDDELYLTIMVDHLSCKNCANRGSQTIGHQHEKSLSRSTHLRLAFLIYEQSTRHIEEIECHTIDDT